jgi:hypothetical protein
MVMELSLPAHPKGNPLLTLAYANQLTMAIFPARKMGTTPWRTQHLWAIQPSRTWIQWQSLREPSMG